MSTTSQINWKDIVKKEARGKNNYDLGEVQSVRTCYVHTEKGLVNVKQYYIPRDLVKDFDGKTVHFDVSEENAVKFVTKQSPHTETNDCMKYETGTEMKAASDLTNKMTYEAETEVKEASDLTNKALVFPDTKQTSDLSDIVERIPLMTQRLDVNKHTVREEATITKIPYMETQTKDVPVMHEVLTIERVRSSGNTAIPAEKTGLTPEVIKVTLEHEAVDVTKTPQVKEELIIHKKPVTETYHVSEEIRSERFETSENIKDTTNEEEKKKTAMT
jgi:uncharacterized protein (TIGR02271 family)